MLLAQVNQFKNFWFEVLKLNRQLRSAFQSARLLRLPDLAKPITTGMIKQALRLSEITVLNKAMHVTQYNKIIVDCAAILHNPGSQ
jgi:hypothetical protein